MGNKVFLYRTKEADDRDCCAYIDIADLQKVHICCDGKFNIYGACYSMSLGGRYANLSYSEIDTYLTEEQYNRLLNPKSIDVPNSDDFTDIIEALQSAEAADFYAEIIASEQKYMMEEHNLDIDDIQEIYDNYSLDYMDRAVIDCVYESAADVGEAEMENSFSCHSEMEYLMKDFDYESFGEDIVNESEFYYELSDGRIVRFNY